MSKRETHLYEFGPYRLIPEEQLLLRDGRPVQLTPKAFETLLALVRRGGRLVEKDELLDEVWAGTTVEESNVAQNIFALRRALGDGEGGQRYIETVPKRGYRFLASVRVIEATAEEVSVQNHVRVRSTAPPPEADAPREGSPGAGEEEALNLVGVDGETAAGPPGGAFAGLGPTLNDEKLGTLGRTPGSAAVRRNGPGAKGAALILLVSLAAALGLAAMFYKWSRPAAPHSPFQRMKIARLTTTGKVFNAAVSPDGKYVVYATIEGNRQGLWMRQTGTQGQVQIVAPDEVTYTGLTFSPDSDHIYYSVFSRAFPNRALFRVPTLGGAARKVLENLRANPVSFSPDGRQFTFIRFVPGKESALMIANADGTGERKLLEHGAGGTIRFPAWSPDGKRIAYVADYYASNDSAVFEAQVADGSARPLTAQRWFRISGVSWLSDGSGLIALCSGGQDFAAQIWQLSYPGGEARRVTNDLNNYEWLSLTADSNALAAVTWQREANIWVAPVNDSGRARAVTSGSGISETCVSWTPDGRIVYHSNASGTDDIWITNADGGERKQLTSDARLNQCPAVSPDGRTIVFLSDRSGTPHLWRMNTDGSDQRQLANGVGGEQNPQFSPDGRWIVYRTNLGKPTVWRMPAGGGDPVQLTDKISFGPTVSPDSKLVAYTFRNDDDRLHIAVAPLEGGEPLKTFPIQPDFTFIRFVRWTPDGRAFAYIETRDGVSNIVAQPLDGGKPVPLTDFKEGQLFSFAFSPDGKQLALSRGAINRDVVLIRDFR
jgi:eukaryotic-like serine/threonine-protein kinase